MKKLFIFICILIYSSCVKTYSDDLFIQSDYFHSECKIENVEYFGSYNINYPIEAEVYLIRREKTVLSVIEYEFEDNIYTMTKDTVYIDKEVYRYDFEEFKKLLINKNQIPRDTTIFKITSNMYCDWNTFDQMYSKYIK